MSKELKLNEAQIKSLCTNGWNKGFIIMLAKSTQNDDYLAKATGKPIKEVLAKKAEIEKMVLAKEEEAKKPSKKVEKKKARPFSANEIKKLMDPSYSNMELARMLNRPYPSIYAKRKQLGVVEKPQVEIPMVKEPNPGPMPYSTANSFQKILDRQELNDVELIIHEDISVIAAIKEEMEVMNTTFSKIKIHLGKGYDAEKLRFICDCYRHDVDMSKYINDYKPDQLKVLRDGIKNKVDIRVFANPLIPAQAMQLTLESLMTAK